MILMRIVGAKDQKAVFSMKLLLCLEFRYCTLNKTYGTSISTSIQKPRASDPYSPFYYSTPFLFKTQNKACRTNCLKELASSIPFNREKFNSDERTHLFFVVFFAYFVLRNIHFQSSHWLDDFRRVLDTQFLFFTLCCMHTILIVLHHKFSFSHNFFSLVAPHKFVN